MASKYEFDAAALFPSRSGKGKDIFINIDGVLFEGFNEVTITATIDGIPQASMLAIMPEEGSQFYDALTPFSNALIQIWIRDDESSAFRNIISGPIRSVVPEVSKDDKKVRVEVISAPAILAEASPPASMRLQYKNILLSDIVTEVCTAYDVPSFVYANAAKTFVVDEVKFDDVTPPWNKLVELCKQAGVFIRSEIAGIVHVLELNWEYQIGINTNEGPTLDTTTGGITSVTCDITDSEFYSAIDLRIPPKSGRKGEPKIPGKSIVVDNPWAPESLNRRFTMKVDKRDPRKTEADMAKDKMAKLLGGAISWTFTTSQWWNEINELFKPGKMLHCYAPQAFMRSVTILVIDKAEYMYSKGDMSVKLTMKLPCIYTGIIPEYDPPWSGSKETAKGFASLMKARSKANETTTLFSGI